MVGGTGNLLLLVVSLVTVESVITQFKWTDCASADANRALQIQEITATPMPLVTPGPLIIHVKGQVTKPITKWSLKLDINRHTFAGKIHIPCEKGFGSCTTDGCKALNELKNLKDTGITDIASQVDKMLKQSHIDINCPVKAQQINVANFEFKIPELGAIASALTNGDYTVTVRALNPDSGELYGCVNFDASLKRKCVGWLCTR